MNTNLSNAQTYEAERQRAEFLGELNQVKTAFLSSISHEFRTPLTLILGSVEEILQGEDCLNFSQREQLTIAKRNSLRLLKLVNTLVDFSSIEAERIQAVYEPTDLATLTIELVSMFRSSIERAGIHLIIDCPPLPEPVYIDREVWEKIVMNLFSNALKFTFKSEIILSLRWGITESNPVLGTDIIEKNNGRFRNNTQRPLLSKHSDYFAVYDQLINSVYYQSLMQRTEYPPFL